MDGCIHAAILWDSARHDMAATTLNLSLSRKIIRRRLLCFLSMFPAVAGPWSLPSAAACAVSSPSASVPCCGGSRERPVTVPGAAHPGGRAARAPSSVWTPALRTRHCRGGLGRAPWCSARCGSLAWILVCMLTTCRHPLLAQQSTHKCKLAAVIKLESVESCIANN